MTDVYYTQKQGLGENFTAYLSNEHYDPNLATDLTLCGYGDEAERNDQNQNEVRCQQPMQSQYVVVVGDVSANTFHVCELYAYSRLSDYLL